MRKFKILLLAVAGLALLAACEKEPQVDTSLAVTPRSTWLEADAGTVFVTVSAKGDWTLRLEYPEGMAPWATVAPSSGSGDKADVVLRYDANEGEDPRTVTLVLSSGVGLPATTLVQQSGIVPETGPGSMAGGYGYDVAPASLDWLELPATKEKDGRELLIHNMDGGKYLARERDGVRNWSCYWDYDEHLSLWVAYPLNNALKGSGSRSNSWGYDALLPTNIQPDLTRGSYGGGWTRGHQIPSADRLASYKANASTFVPTNMTPQDYDFNCNIWADLEGKVRNYASQADTLYVVTGCLFELSTRWSGSSSGFAVKIPTHYFKALLYKGSSTYATNGYMAAGFLLPHDTGISGGNYLDYICSIDQLEQQTGIDFFPNLIGKLGQATADQIEAEAPSKWWR
jgi:endonuclease G